MGVREGSLLFKSFALARAILLLYSHDNQVVCKKSFFPSFSVRFEHVFFFRRGVLSYVQYSLHTYLSTYLPYPTLPPYIHTYSIHLT